MSAVVLAGGKILGAAGAVFSIGSAVATGWQTLKVGAGGYVRGMYIAPDGTMVARTDTNGAYYYNGTQWNQLFNVNSIPSSLINSTDIGTIGDGCLEIQVAPSNTQIFYAIYLGLVWVSTNRGTTWTQTAFTQLTNLIGNSTNGPNGSYGQWGQKLAIDPHNSNIVFVGTGTNGLLVTTNGGTSWSTVSGVPAGSGAGVSGILFDPNSTVTGGATQTLYACVYGTGVYESTNGGSTWALTSGGPTIVINAVMDSASNYYAACPGDLYKFNGSAWSTLLTDSQGVQSVAVNPFNNSEVVAIRASGNINVSYNGGSTWSGVNNSTNTASTDIPWIAAANYSGTPDAIYLDVGNSAFSPTTNGLLVMSAGTGMWTQTIPSSGFTGTTPATWTDLSVAIEQIVANEILIAPYSGSTPLLAGWDRPVFNIASLTSYPSTYGPVNSSNIQFSPSLDYASSSPSTIVAIVGWQGVSQSGVTTNNGVSWTTFGATASNWSQSFGNGGGSIAASTPSNIVWAPAGGVAPSYTTSGGASWTTISIAGVSWTGFQGQYYNWQRAVAADRVTANKFYLYVAKAASGNGLYVSTNSGATWTQQLAGYIESNSGWAGFNSTLLAVPGNAGHLFYTSGNQAGTTPNSGSVVPFYRSTNSGASWSAVSGPTGVQCFNFGAIASGYTYPSIYVVGWVGGVYGVWYSVDDAVTWTGLGNPNASLQTLTLIKTIAADPNNFGYVYVGMQGAGYAYHAP